MDALLVAFDSHFQAWRSYFQLKPAGPWAAASLMDTLALGLYGHIGAADVFFSVHVGAWLYEHSFLSKRGAWHKGPHILAHAVCSRSADADCKVLCSVVLDSQF